MLKTQTPRYTSMAPTKSAASNHLWDDFVQQIAGYARRNNVAHKGLPVSERGVRNQAQAPKTWYNKSQSAR